MCENILPFNEVVVDENDKPDKDCIGYIVFSCMTCALKVLLNLTHDNSKWNFAALIKTRVVPMLMHGRTCVFIKVCLTGNLLGTNGGLEESPSLT